MRLINCLKLAVNSKIHNFMLYTSIIGIRQALLLHIARLLGISTLSLKISNIIYPVQCRPNDSDRRALSQVFIERDSDVLMPFIPKLIIDGGANVGYASVLFANKYPNTRILAIEPDFANYQIAKKNCSKYPNVEVIHAGIWKYDTSLIIKNPDAASWAFEVSETVSSTPNSVHGYSISSLLSYSNIDTIDLLKLDIEGTEEHIFSSPNLDWLNKVKVLVVETHSKASHEAVISAMVKYAFTQSAQGEKHVFINQSL